LKKILIECTLTAVKLFIQLYNNKAISLETFKSHTWLKIKFLKDYISQTDSDKSQLSQDIIDIIMEYESILRSDYASYNTQL